MPNTEAKDEARCLRDCLDAAPLGTKAPALMGGCWTRVEHGWQWGKNGGVFPTPGGDWMGRLIYPGENNEWDG